MEEYMLLSRTVSHVAQHCPFLSYSLFILLQTFLCLPVYCHTQFLSVYFPCHSLCTLCISSHWCLFQHFSYFFIPLRIVFNGSEAAIIYRCVKHRNAATRITPFKVKCTERMFPKGRTITLITTRVFLHAFRVEESIHQYTLKQCGMMIIWQQKEICLKHFFISALAMLHIWRFL